GTTGKPKGVMLTHKNIMSDISALLYNLAPVGGDEWLSFLPLSHTFERTTSYYIGLGMGNKVTFSRGVTRILDDLKHTRPTIMMSVPRVYEKVAAKIKERLKTKGSAAQFVFNSAVNAGYRRFERRNGLAAHNPFINTLDDLLDPFYNKTVRNQIRNSFGGRLRVAVSGGAALSTDVARTLIGLGVEIYQGYGMTETSPIISVNKIGANHPDTVGPILPGIEAKIGDKDELLVRGPQVMKGYWKRPEDTAKTISPEGWLSTGDQAEIGEGRYLKIKGRIKEIIVTSTGEKVPPVDIEQAIETDPLFDQAMIYGDNRPFICALLVVNQDQFADFVKQLSLDPNDPDIMTNSTVIRAVLKRLKSDCRQFPQYGVPRAVKLLSEPWTIDNGALTPTLKIKRRVIVADNQTDIDNLYKNFGK
ncbi:AMP-binding protein, partial [uncultured Parasutterella sp.]